MNPIPRLSDEPTHPPTNPLDTNKLIKVKVSDSFRSEITFHAHLAKRIVIIFIPSCKPSLWILNIGPEMDIINPKILSSILRKKKKSPVSCLIRQTAQRRSHKNLWKRSYITITEEVAYNPYATLGF
ncbi:hypothetical protein PanWU01x14_140780 [Parasponia andersonii]|uniref:Uncharacterized protein n=1 Tax=Parasponia andersonii TaxID=3476 RepID=A0A2P5CM48_PARAD|nr:hypothetical protein PanWU01x14_140780 [Parasponia andersonii]